jgi:hypothetical protein
LKKHQPPRITIQAYTTKKATKQKIELTQQRKIKKGGKRPPKKNLRFRSNDE